MVFIQAKETFLKLLVFNSLKIWLLISTYIVFVYLRLIIFFGGGQENGFLFSSPAKTDYQKQTNIISKNVQKF